MQWLTRFASTGRPARRLETGEQAPAAGCPPKELRPEGGNRHCDAGRPAAPADSTACFPSLSPSPLPASTNADIRIAIVLTPPTDQHFRWAAQVGVTDFVARYPMVDTTEKLEALHARAAGFSLRLSVVEGYLPLNRIVFGAPGRDEQIAEIAQLIRGMGRLDIPILCYNFMPHMDMSRTSFDLPERGGAVSNGFDAAQVESVAETDRITAPQLWENLEYFLKQVVPVAEAAGVRLAMHPDDPPLPVLQGSEQIMATVEAFERLVGLVPSPANGVCFCQGTFAELGVDIPATIRRLGPHIRYVHFRDVRGTVPRFQETFHDNGKTDMVAAMKAYAEIGYRGAMRPDHVPKLDGEPGIADGYSMLARLFAVGYMRGLIHAVQGTVSGRE
jgi:mannonate dehydratase